MGNSIDIQSRFIPFTVFQESLINLSNVIQNAYILNTDETDRIPLGPASTDSNDTLYTYNLREFSPIIKPGGLVEITRKNYYASDEICCLQDQRYGWTNPFLNDFSQQSDLSKILVTCHPYSSELGYSQVCDPIMKSVCVDNYDKTLYHKCKVWLSGVYKRAQTDQNKLVLINNVMTEKCKDNAISDNCIMWLDAIRNGNQEDFFGIADNIILSQLDKSAFKCAVSPSYIIDLQKQYGNKECWYKDCSFAEKWRLLTENIVKRNACTLSECNVNIKNLNVIDPSDIDIICDNNNKQVSSKFISDVIQNDMNDDLFLPSYVISFLLILLFLLFSVIKR